MDTGESSDGGTQWDDANIGPRSFVGGGFSNTSSGLNSFVGGGTGNIASGTDSFVGGGFSNTASGFDSFAGGGENNTASGGGSFAGGGFGNIISGFASFVGGGTGNTASGDHSFAAGSNTIAKSFAETVVGTFNTDYTANSTNSFNANDRLFVIGNGTATNARSNAVTVLKNANVGIGNTASIPAIHLAIRDNGNGLHRPAANVLAIHTNGQEQMRVTSNGRMGIGTTSPHSIIAIRSSDHNQDGPIITLGGHAPNQAESGRIRFLDGTTQTNWRGAYIHYNGTNDRLHIGVHNEGDDDIANDVNAITIVRANARVGFGIETPVHPLHMGSGAHCTDAGVWINASDRRLKEDIIPIGYGLGTVLALRPVSYHMRSTGVAQIGFIAQDVQALIPELVSGSEGDPDQGDILGMSYGNMTAIVVKAMQEQQEIIEQQQQIIEQQQQNIRKQDDRIAGLELRLESILHLLARQAMH